MWAGAASVLLDQGEQLREVEVLRQALVEVVDDQQHRREARPHECGQMIHHPRGVPRAYVQNRPAILDGHAGNLEQCAGLADTAVSAHQDGVRAVIGTQPLPDAARSPDGFGVRLDVGHDVVEQTGTIAVQ
ncbi:hypothetical protein AB0B48_22300 [Micromonospora sp. NPDC049089]|uniref:hypothetical protein n=1 Tax=Micromonospora sp. NPDC049089 TaxID=3155496 RepID=UPI0033DBEE7D